ncbi:MAG: tetratricopeptide repeat protein [Phycisphaerales bacterium]|nr:MAG: tetratricopeptide repeat protein [Phycisphaerales bacterium]
MTRILAGVVALAYVGLDAPAQEKDVHLRVREANRAFADGDYVAALEAYKAVGKTLPDSPEVAFNQGVAYYKMGDYTQARDALNRSLTTHDAKLEVKAKFNLGNIAYASARQKMSNPTEAIGLLKTAIGYYRDAVELDPEDEGARINIELAQRLIRELLDKLNEQRDERRSQEDEEQEPQEESQDQRQGGQGTGEQEAGAEQQQKQLQGQAEDSMTPQEAEQLLQAVRDEEQRRRKELARRRRLQRVPVERDW